MVDPVKPHQDPSVIPEGVWNITEVIEHRARRQPAAPALILPERMLSFRELVTAVHVVALKLLANGTLIRGNGQHHRTMRSAMRYRKNID